MAGSGSRTADKFVAHLIEEIKPGSRGRLFLPRSLSTGRLLWAPRQRRAMFCANYSRQTLFMAAECQVGGLVGMLKPNVTSAAFGCS